MKCIFYFVYNYIYGHNSVYSEHALKSNTLVIFIGEQNLF